MRIQLIGLCCWTLGELIVTSKFRMKASKEVPGLICWGNLGFNVYNKISSMQQNKLSDTK